MSVKRDQLDVQRHRQEIARLQQEKIDETTKAAQAIKNARSVAENASRNRDFLSRAGMPQGHIDFVFGSDMRQSSGTKKKPINVGKGLRKSRQRSRASRNSWTRLRID